MKLSEEALKDFQQKKVDYETAQSNLAHTTSRKHAISIQATNDLNNFNKAFEDFKGVQGEIVREYGEGVQVDLATGEIINPK